MDDSEVVKAVNERDRNASNADLTSFIFTLKNRVGGLARALRVFQENGINVVHIESRKSLRTNSEYEIFVSLESQQGKVQVPELARSLKKQLSYIKIDGDNSESKPVVSTDEPVGIGSLAQANESLDDDLFDTTHSSVVNSNGQLVRKSTICLSKRD